MWEAGKAAVEWLGINVLAAQIMDWVSANGSLGVSIIVGLGVVAAFLGAVVMMHKMERFPVTIPYARALVPLALCMAMLVLLGLTVMAGLTFWRDGSPSRLPNSGPSANSHSTSGTPPDGSAPTESLYGGR